MRKLVFIFTLFFTVPLLSSHGYSFPFPSINNSLEGISTGVDTFIEREIIWAVDRLLEDCEDHQNAYSCTQRFQGVSNWMRRVQSDLNIFKVTLIPLVATHQRARVLLDKVNASLNMMENGLEELGDLKNCIFITCNWGWSLLKSHMREHAKSLNDRYQFKPVKTQGLLSKMTRLTLNLGSQMISNHQCTP